MTAPDLVRQAQSRKKMSFHQLGHSESKVSALTLLSAHLLDFVMVYALTALITAFYRNIFKSMMMTSGLEKAFSKNTHYPEFLITFSVVMFSYFFFSHFFNHGQTFGMHKLKVRFVLRQHSFSQSFYATLSCLSLYLTGGLALKGVQKAFASHDHLYADLLQPREMSPMHLVNVIEKGEENTFAEELRAA